MPELPEVETVRRGLEGVMVGKTIALVTLARYDLRVPFPPLFAQKLTGRQVLGVERRGKYLLIRLDGGQAWITHLGMSGRFIHSEHPPPELGKHDHVRIDIWGGGTLIYNDPRRFGLMTLCANEELADHPLFRGLGPEPLGDDFTPAYLAGALKGRKQEIKQLLMDSHIVVGVGNIYASEALFEARMHPETTADKAASKAAALVAAIRTVLNDAIASGGSSLRDFFSVGGEAGYFQHKFKVYGREGKPCAVCKTNIRKFSQGGRSTFYCPKCQR